MASVVPTRRRTPDHPPYALMIGAAINSLAEEGGSTEESISRFIRSNYGDIPPAHDLLLPYYLAKLTANSEFAISTPGRYVVPRHVDGEVVDADIEEGLPLDCDGDVVMAVEALPAKRRRGRPPKENSKTTACAIGGRDGLSLVLVESEIDKVARKRSRRLPKCKTESPFGDFSDDRKGKSEPVSVATIAKKTGKRRGRPPKSARKLDEDMLLTAMTILETPISDESKSVETTVENTGKRRGRPPAKKTDGPKTARGRPPKSAKKTDGPKTARGRPPKSAKKTDGPETAATSGKSPDSVEKTDKDGPEPPESVVLTAEKTGKRRGRPPKRKVDAMDCNPENC